MHPDNSHERSEDDNHDNTLEIDKIKNQIESADKLFYDELASKYHLLEKFSTEQLREMCSNMLGRGPDVEYYHDEHTNKISELPQYKEDYIHFIIDEFQFSEIKGYALQNDIVARYIFENLK